MAMIADGTAFDIHVVGVGDVSSALQMLFMLIENDAETEASCGLLLERFRVAYNEIMRRKAEGDREPPEDTVFAFTDALAHFLEALRPYEYFTPMERARNHGNLGRALANGHRALDSVYHELGIPFTEDWRREWQNGAAAFTIQGVAADADVDVDVDVAAAIGMDVPAVDVSAIRLSEGNERVAEATSTMTGDDVLHNEVEEEEDTSIYVQVFKLCSGDGDGIPSASGAFKLQQRRITSEAELGTITAISYAWGSLDHTVADSWTLESGKTIHLRLGTEWNHTKFLQELVLLSASSWLWLDQLSLNQGAVSSKELTVCIPTVYKTAKRDWISFSTSDGQLIARETSYRSTKTINRLMNHRRECACLHGIEMWLQRVWPWQEVAYARRLQVRRVAGSDQRSPSSSFDLLTLLRQLILDKRARSNEFMSDSPAVRDEEGDAMFFRLLKGEELTFRPFTTIARKAILPYLSDYAEQNRTCSKDPDLISAVAPTIGAVVDTPQSLPEGTESLVKYVVRRTNSVFVGPLPRGLFKKTDPFYEPGPSFVAHGSTFPSLSAFSPPTQIAMLHGTHFAPRNVEDGGDLHGAVDCGVSVTDFPGAWSTQTAARNALFQEMVQFDLGLFLRAMAVGQRRILVRWLKSWEPRGGQFDRTLLSLQAFTFRHDVTSEASFQWWNTKSVQTRKLAFFQLAFMLLRVNDTTAIMCGCRPVIINRAQKLTATVFREQGIAIRHYWKN